MSRSYTITDCVISVLKFSVLLFGLKADLDHRDVTDDDFYSLSPNLICRSYSCAIPSLIRISVAVRVTLELGHAIDVTEHGYSEEKLIMHFRGAAVAFT